MRTTIWTGWVLAAASCACAGEFERFAQRTALIQKADLIVIGEVSHVTRRESARAMVRKKRAQTWPVTVLPRQVLKGKAEGAPAFPVRVDGAGNYLDASGETRLVREGDLGTWYFVRTENGLQLEAFVHVERTLAHLSKTSRHKNATPEHALACERATVERYVAGLTCSAARRAFAGAPRGERGEANYARATLALSNLREAERTFIRAYAPRREHEEDYLLTALREPTRKLARLARKHGYAPDGK